MRTHCAYPVEKQNGTRQSVTRKQVPAGLRLFPLVLMYMRARVRRKYGLNAFEILFGRPLNTGIGPQLRLLPSADSCEDEMLRYCANLITVLLDVQTGERRSTT